MKRQRTGLGADDAGSTHRSAQADVAHLRWDVCDIKDDARTLGWQRADEYDYPQEPANLAISLGVNFAVYALSH